MLTAFMSQQIIPLPLLLQSSAKVAKETKTPIVAGSVEQVDDGALATYGIDYKSLAFKQGN